MAPHGLPIGGFVSLPTPERIGRLIGISGTTARVYITRSLTEQSEEHFELSVLRRRHLYPQTRVFIFDAQANVWLSGRIREPDPAHQCADGLTAYSIALPNGNERVLCEHEFEVRSFGRVSDPTDLLKSGAAETQFLHDRRLSVQRSILEMRAASRGLESLVSASVELVTHQIEVVRRVLSDPLQRYMLADEVGLGKTIEAGAIVKQVLQESPLRRVAIVVPSSLVLQWQGELKSKFDIDTTTDDGVIVVTRDELGVIAENTDEFELLVVDEAHHLTGDPATARRLREIAHAVPRLLLLTATPVLGNEQALLELLHLLDPASYPLSDIDGFHAKFAQREKFGELLLALDAEVPLAILQPTLTELAGLVSDDEVVQTLVEDALASSNDPEALLRAIRSLRAHISETYRLYQRLVRTRRSDVSRTDPRWPARRCTVLVEEDEDVRIEELVLALEDWRESALRDLDPSAETTEIDARSVIYCELLEALGCGADDFQAYLEVRQRQGTVCFPSEGSWIENALSLCRQPTATNRAAQAAGLITRAVRSVHGLEPARFVAFTSSKQFAEELAANLAGTAGLTVAQVLAGMEDDAVQEQLEVFTSSPRNAVLIGDRSAEEGLNLQMADALFFLDLPFSLSRLEQRIGRLDRFGRKQTNIPLHVFLPSYADEAPWSAWLTILDEGFGLFGRSISDLQLLVDELELDIRHTLFTQGAEGLLDYCDALVNRVATERKRQDQQYALDVLNADPSSSSRVYKSLEAGDAEAPEFAHSLDDWLFRVMQLQRYGSQDIFTVDWGNRTLATLDWKPDYAPSLRRKLTYKRDVAIKSDARLIQPGLPLVDATERFLRYDDRGTAFATLRPDERWGADSGIWTGFQLAYLVEVDEAAILEAIARLGVRLPQTTLIRQAHAILPQWIGAISIDTGFKPVTDPLLAEILARPYSTPPDINLGSRPDLWGSIIRRRDLVELSTEARRRSEEMLRESELFRAEYEGERRRAAQAMSERIEGMERRIASLARMGRHDSFQEETLLATQAIASALVTPQVHLATIGFMAVIHPGAQP